MKEVISLVKVHASCLNTTVIKIIEREEVAIHIGSLELVF